MPTHTSGTYNHRGWLAAGDPEHGAEALERTTVCGLQSARNCSPSSWSLLGSQPIVSSLVAEMTQYNESTLQMGKLGTVTLKKFVPPSLPIH